MPRPLIEIDWSAFDKLCELQCTLRELSAFFECSEDTIERACQREKKISFADYVAQKGGKGRISLRRKQFEIAMMGSVTMLIWLGKQFLGQADKPQFSTDGDGFEFVGGPRDKSD